MRDEWKTCKLGEISDVGAGNSAPQDKASFENGHYPFIRTADVGKVRFGSIVDSVDKLNDQGARGLRLVPKGSILLPKSGASTFLNYRVMLEQDSYVASHLATVKADLNFVAERYLLYFLCTIKAQDIIQDHKYPSLKLADIKNIPVSFPSISTQNGIVAILDEVFKGIETAIAHTEKSLANAQELFDSYLELTFSSAPNSWSGKKLGEICDIKHGFAFKSKYFSDQGDYILLTPGSFWEKGGFRDQGDKTKYYIGEIPPNFVLEKDDFLIAMTEQAKGLLGSTLVVPESDRFLHNQRLGLVQAKEGFEWHNDFFFHQFNTRAFRAAVQETASGVKVRHTSPKKIGAIPVKVPPTKREQVSVAEHLNELQTETRRLEQAYHQKLQALNELKQSLLQKAFAGELTAEKAENQVQEAMA
jgi:type I restriction enzyme S subunit